MASYLPDLRRDNIALYTVPLFWAIAISPRMWAKTVFEKATREKLDIRLPRDFQKQAADNLTLSENVRGQVRRAEAAVSNGFENFGPFCAAVTAGSVAGLDALTVNSLTLGYLASRILYNWLYVSGDTKSKASARSAVYMGGLGMLMTLFVKAGSKLRR